MYGWIPAVESRFYSAGEVCVERAPRRRCARVELSVVLKRRRARHWIPWDFLPPLTELAYLQKAKEYSLHYTQNFLLISLQSVKEIHFKWHRLTFLCVSFNTYWWRARVCVCVCMRACSDEIRFALIWCLTLKISTGFLQLKNNMKSACMLDAFPIYWPLAENIYNGISNR